MVKSDMSVLGLRRRGGKGSRTSNVTKKEHLLTGYRKGRSRLGMSREVRAQRKWYPVGSKECTEGRRDHRPICPSSERLFPGEKHEKSLSAGEVVLKILVTLFTVITRKSEKFPSI